MRVHLHTQAPGQHDFLAAMTAIGQPWPPVANHIFIFAKVSRPAMEHVPVIVNSPLAMAMVASQALTPIGEPEAPSQP